MFQLDAIVEIPYGSRYKYEMDKKTGELVVDRPLPKPLPYTYGFIPCTLHEDGDPLDVCIIGEDLIYPLTRVKIWVLGAFLCTDNGYSDHKLVAIMVGEEGKHDLNAGLDFIREHLSTYKSGFTVGDYVTVDEARQILMKDMQAYQDD